MKTIYKYPIEITDHQRVEVVWEAMPMHAGLDTEGEPCIWCEVEAKYAENAKHREHLDVFVIGTGNPMPARARTHVGSFNQGPFVWHIYTP